MDTHKVILAVAILLVFGFIYWWARRTPANESRSATAAGSEKPKPMPEALRLLQSEGYCGVQIRPGSCGAASAMQGKSWSLEKAPALPLSGCDAQCCQCQYIGIPDSRIQPRRADPDRRDELRFDTEHPDRRELQDRRASGRAWTHNPGH